MGEWKDLTAARAAGGREHKGARACAHACTDACMDACTDAREHGRTARPPARRTHARTLARAQSRTPHTRRAAPHECARVRTHAHAHAHARCAAPHPARRAAPVPHTLTHAHSRSARACTHAPAWIVGAAVLSGTCALDGGGSVEWFVISTTDTVTVPPIRIYVCAHAYRSKLGVPEQCHGSLQCPTHAHFMTNACLMHA